MNDLISRLGSFFTNVVPKTAAISLPGVLGALVLAFIIWPPTPHDEIACVTNLGEVEDFNGVTRTEAPPVGCAAYRDSSVDFSLSATPTSLTTIDSSKGGTVTYEITATPSQSFSGDVALIATGGWPNNAKLTFDPLSIKGKGTAKFSVAVPSKSPAGIYKITIQGMGNGASGKIAHRTSVPLTVLDSAGFSPNSVFVPTPRAERQLALVCEFRMLSLATIDLSGGKERLDLSVRKQTAFKNQEVLDGAQREMGECIRLELSHVGEEGNEIDKLKYQIGIEEKERDALQLQYLGYQKTGSSLTGQFQKKFEIAQGKIAADQNQIIIEQQDLRERQAHIDLENDFLKEINARLADPGRIRPALNFDDYLAALGNHALAIGVLAVGVGLVLDPINLAVSGAIFDGPFVWVWNKLRRRRPQVYRIKGKMPDASDASQRAKRTGPVKFMATGMRKEPNEEDPFATYSLANPFMIPISVRISPPPKK